MTRGPDGALIVCDQGDHTHEAQLSRADPDTGGTTTLASAWHGRPLNSPNDVPVRGDGTIWFPAPSYGQPAGLPAPTTMSGRRVLPRSGHGPVDDGRRPPRQAERSGLLARPQRVVRDR